MVMEYSSATRLKKSDIRQKNANCDKFFDWNRQNTDAYLEARFGIIANVMRVTNVGRNACAAGFMYILSKYGMERCFKTMGHPWTEKWH